jgi:hypothetical protein
VGESLRVLGHLEEVRATQNLSRIKIARSLPHVALLARELVNFRFKVGHNGPEDAVDWREV